jgi:hypothetical protein
MPSVAGVAIVKWISFHGRDNMLSILSLPSAKEPLDTASLVLLFLYGNLFCYVASYPALVFHATRVLDFEDDRWTGRTPLDGYIATGLLTLLALTATLVPQHCRPWAAFLLTAAFAAVQLRRVWLVFSIRKVVKNCRGVHGEPGGDVTSIYGYSFTLATRRGKRVKIIESEKKEDEKVAGGNSKADEQFEDDDERVKTKLGEVLWHKEYVETYRHLREHGNSALIFLLELALAALIYCITIPDNSGDRQLSTIGVLFAVWAFPAIWTHLMGQYLERRFSHFDRRVRS